MIWMPRITQLSSVFSFVSPPWPSSLPSRPSRRPALTLLGSPPPSPNGHLLARPEPPLPPGPKPQSGRIRVPIKSGQSEGGLARNNRLDNPKGAQPGLGSCGPHRSPDMFGQGIWARSGPLVTCPSQGSLLLPSSHHGPKGGPTPPSRGSRGSFGDPKPSQGNIPKKREYVTHDPKIFLTNK